MALSKDASAQTSRLLLIQTGHTRQLMAVGA